MSTTIQQHSSGAEFIEVEFEAPGGATTLLIRVGDWTARLDVVAGCGEDASEHVMEVSAFEVPDGRVDGSLMPPSQAGVVEGEPDGDPVAVFLFGGEEDSGAA